MLKHRAICFFQNILSHIHYIVRPHTQKLSIECRMMKFAQRKTIRYHWRTIGI